MKMMALAHFLAQTQDASLLMQRLLPWLLLLFALILVGGLFLMWYRAKLKKEETQQEPMGFSLADLKKLRDRGELSPEEYEVAKNRILLKHNANLAGKGAKQNKPEAPKDDAEPESN